MVSKVALVEELKKKQRQHKQQQEEKEKSKGNHHQQKQIQCNMGSVSKFKKSCFNGKEDGATSAILLLACIAFAPSG
ncbi:hypothetical protein IFM89_005852 [Coptis chinensis]|uniref:Uncharacterized protein n=1 Tax=Coptis chinensis TaxID=261450 RepID=A0A835LUT2_9MAGN|nr:hypothetical protein IFM89_005852 [Coptis chinensis]